MGSTVLVITEQRVGVILGAHYQAFRRLHDAFTTAQVSEPQPFVSSSSSQPVDVVLSRDFCAWRPDLTRHLRVLRLRGLFFGFEGGCTLGQALQTGSFPSLQVSLATTHASHIYHRHQAQG